MVPSHNQLLLPVVRVRERDEKRWFPPATVAFILAFNLVAWVVIIGEIITFI